MGLVVAASGTLVPLLLRFGLPITWTGLGGISAVLTLVAWGGWPVETAHHRAAARTPSLPTWSRPVAALLLEYGLNAVGMVPHMVFLVDFVARGLNQGLAAGAGYWVVYGLGAMAGPLLAGALADRVGFRTAYQFAFVVQATAVALPVWFDGPGWLAVSALVVGAFIPGVVPLALGRVHAVLPSDMAAQRLFWGRITMSWAVFQAAAAYLDSWLFAQTGSYRLLFAMGSSALVLALVVDLLAGYSAAASAASGSSAT